MQQSDKIRGRSLNWTESYKVSTFDRPLRLRKIQLASIHKVDRQPIEFFLFSREQSEPENNNWDHI